jgi:hypothetical protein
VTPLPEHFQIPPSRIPGPQSLGKKEICREGWDLGFIYPNETSPSFHSSGWENDVTHKIINGQWNNGNVFMIEL